MWEHSPTCKTSNRPSRSFLPPLPSGSSPKVSGEWAGLSGLGTRRREARGQAGSPTAPTPTLRGSGALRGPRGLLTLLSLPPPLPAEEAAEEEEEEGEAWTPRGCSLEGCPAGPGGEGALGRAEAGGDGAPDRPGFRSFNSLSPLFPLCPPLPGVAAPPRSPILASPLSPSPLPPPQPPRSRSRWQSEVTAAASLAETDILGP